MHNCGSIVVIVVSHSTGHAPVWVPASFGTGLGLAGGRCGCVCLPIGIRMTTTSLLSSRVGGCGVSWEVCGVAVHDAKVGGGLGFCG